MKHAWLFVLVAASGCVDLKAEYPERRFYTLSAERLGAATVPAKDGVLRVRRFTASKVCDGSELVTRTGDSEYETDFYNAFFAPPVMQLTEQVQRWLGAAGLFSAVVGGGSSLAETHVLEGNMVALHIDERDKRSAAVLEFQVLLIRVGSDPAAVVFQKTYKGSELVKPGSPESAVKAWNVVLQRILMELEADLLKADRSSKK